jgi:amino acid transporter
MATEAHGVTAAPEGRIFTRQATGLVRSVSPVSTLIFNCFTAPAPFVLAIALFWTLGVFPGANLYVALLLGYGAGVIFSFAISAVSSAIPRSGGDYVFVGRILHPLAGITSSFCFTAGVLLSIAGITLALITQALAPSLNVIGLVGHSPTLLNWGSTLGSNQGWQFGLGVGFMALAALLVGVGWKWSLRAQNVAFLIAGLGLLVTAIVVLVKGGSDFVAAFNSFANPITNQPDSYHHIISAAQQAGVNVNPGSQFSNTWPAFGAVIGFSVYTWFSAHIAGEVRQAGTWKTSAVMAGAAVINLAACLLMTLVFFSGFGHKFFVAVNAVNGTKDYPFQAPPFYVFLTSIAGGSATLAWFLGISIVLTFFIVLWLNIVQPVRALFAYAFDGVLPLRIAYVSPRSRVPVVALAITFAISVGLYSWAVYGSNFFTVYATAVIITVAALLLMAISVIAFAHRRPEIWRASVVTKRIGGVPVTTIAGVLALLVAVANGFVFLKYPGLGLTNRGVALRNVGIVVGAAIVVYFIADFVRSRQGIGLSKAASEIPPE